MEKENLFEVIHRFFLLQGNFTRKFVPKRRLSACLRRPSSFALQIILAENKIMVVLLFSRIETSNAEKNVAIKLVTRKREKTHLSVGNYHGKLTHSK